jgi:hypothetical protein
MAADAAIFISASSFEAVAEVIQEPSASAYWKSAILALALRRRRRCEALFVP